jgi:predicted lactoylglutathione lyase
MSVPARVNIITLGVDDLERSAAFYAALGWQRASASTDEIVWFKLTGTVLGLFPYELLAIDANVPVEQRPWFAGVTLAINLESRQAVDEALAAAEAAGGSIAKPGESVEWGGYSGYFADPDGHLWEVAWNPFFKIGPDGLLLMD